MSDQSSANGNSRLDHMEGLMKRLIEDRLRFRDDDRLKALMQAIDHLVRRRPNS